MKLGAFYRDVNGGNRMKARDIYSQPGHLIRRAHQMATAVFANETRDFDLTAVQFSALLVIGDNPGIDATRVSELIYFDRSTIGNVLDRLEKKGLIARKNGMRDRRTKPLYLTPQGKIVTRKVAATAPRVANNILAPLSRVDRIRLMKLLGKVISSDGDTRTTLAD